MMMPGHTHEDIDAMFRFIADSLRSKGLIRTIPEFEDAARSAFKEQVVHVEEVKAVYDYKAWLEPYLGDIGMITTARYFIVKRRASDGWPIMWYKPYVAHKHLYPTVKDASTDMATFEMVDGEKMYTTDMNGIEVFRVLPPAAQQLCWQKFEDDRLNVNEIYERVKEVMEAHPLLFDASSSAWWSMWSQNTTTTVDDAVSGSPMLLEWPAKAHQWEPSQLPGLESNYSETITYLNTQGRQSFNSKNALQAAEEQSSLAPELSEGDLVVVRPGVAYGLHDELPFWVAQVVEKTPSETLEIKIVWRCAFKRGYAQDDVDGQWFHVCKGGSQNSAGMARFHPFTQKCTTAKNKTQHGKMHGTIKREEVVLYFAKLTPKHCHV